MKRIALASFAILVISLLVTNNASSDLGALSSQVYCAKQANSTLCNQCKGDDLCIKCKHDPVCINCKHDPLCIICKNDPVCISCKNDPLCMSCKNDPLCIRCKNDPLCISCKNDSLCIGCKQDPTCINCKGNPLCILTANCKKDPLCISCNQDQLCITCKGDQFCINSAYNYCKGNMDCVQKLSSFSWGEDAKSVSKYNKNCPGCPLGRFQGLNATLKTKYIESNQSTSSLCQEWTIDDHGKRSCWPLGSLTVKCKATLLQDNTPDHPTCSVIGTKCY